MDLAEVKSEVIDEVAAQREQLVKLSLKIHSNPELGFEESQASKWLADYLADKGFSVENGVSGLPTAFRARYGQGRPAIALLAEYDALPKLGHACGHNLIATIAVGAGTASRKAIDRFGGSILVIGTPAEELLGGKAIMAELGVFNELDIAMMVHPGSRNMATTQTLACQPLDVEFTGRAAHAAACPEEGINALEAMLLSFAAINSLRQHTRESCRIHGIITDGGEAANIVPSHSAASLIVRAEDDAYLEVLKKKVIDCFSGAAKSTGARLSYQWREARYSAMLNNINLARLFCQNMASLGRQYLLEADTRNFGSTDMGNVSRLVPAIHPLIAISPPSVVIHSPQFAKAAASERGHRGLIDGAKALAMTVVDLLGQPETVTMIKEEFASNNG
ncbi:MAG: M20 family metallopeptidase [Dehalococcoidales bacterium]